MSARSGRAAGVSSAPLDHTLAALADPARRRTVEILRCGPRRAGELAAALDLPAPVMSRHLRALREAGLVEESHPAHDARVRVYALKVGATSALKVWVDQIEQLWADQLLALKAHVEAREP